MIDRSNLDLRWVESVGEIPQTKWDALAGKEVSPFLEWGWLNQLEVSGSVSPNTGWLPFHLTLWDRDELAAAAPLYVKGSSTGEFLWDWGWADAAAELGLQYFPKMVGTIPATPSGRYRFFISPKYSQAEITRLLISITEKFCKSQGIEGLHLLFTDPAWDINIPGSSYQEWRHQSYLWKNPGYSSFDAYLSAFNKNQRRNIRRELRSMNDRKINLKPLFADDIPEYYFSILYDYYEKTNDQFGIWAAKYLNREFFTGLYDSFRGRILLEAAFHAEDPNPAALSFLVVKDSVMWGRYWGTREYYKDLHFNTCYYAPIEWAIDRGVTEFDPGAGSPHKLRRGFQAVTTSSYHRFFDPAMQKLFSLNIGRINKEVAWQIESMNREIPWKKS